MSLVALEVRGGQALVDDVEGTHFCGRQGCPFYQVQAGLFAGTETASCRLLGYEPGRTCEAYYREQIEAISEAYKRSPLRPAAPPRPIQVRTALRRGGAVTVRLDTETRCRVIDLDGHGLLDALCHVRGDDLFDAATAVRILTITEREIP